MPVTPIRSPYVSLHDRPGYAEGQVAFWQPKTPWALPFLYRAPGTGVGYIAGTVTREGVAAARHVRLYSRVSGLLVGKTESDEDGAYRFDGLNPNELYLVVAIDADDDEFNAAPADLIEPAV